MIVAVAFEAVKSEAVKFSQIVLQSYYAQGPIIKGLTGALGSGSLQIPAGVGWAFFRAPFVQKASEGFFKGPHGY